MKNPSEQDELLADVLADTAPVEFRRKTLEHGLALVRRKQARQNTLRRACVFIPLVILGAMLALQNRQTPTAQVSNEAAPKKQAGTMSSSKLIPGTSIRLINDAELLDLFKDRPVALVGQPGSQRLILLEEVTN